MSRRQSSRQFNPTGMMTEQETAKARERAQTHATKHRGLRFRNLADGSRTYIGFVDNRKVKLEARTERDALAELSDLRAKVSKGVKLAPVNVTFKDVADQWLESKNGRLREWTRLGYRASLDNELLPRFGKLKLREIAVDSVAKFVRDLESQGRSASTIRNHLKPLNQTFAYAVRKGLATSNPVSLLTTDERPRQTEPRKVHEWTPEEIASVFEASERVARKKGAQVNYTLLLRTAIYSGLRLGELLGLQWQDIDFEGGTIHVVRQFSKTGELTPPKTKAGTRRVPIRAELIKALREWRLASSHSKDEDFVFAAREGGSKLHRTIQRAWETIREQAGLPDTITFHDLRHAYASVAIHAGADAVFLARVMGHADPAITLRVYTHMFDTPRREEAFRKAMGQVAW